MANPNPNTEPETSVSRGYRIFSAVRTVAVYIAAALIILAAILFAMDKGPTKSLFGFRYYTVLTDSMQPEFSSGDMVFVKLTGAENIQVQDIITFNPSSSSDAYLTHRVVEKLENYQGSGVTCFRTKGDANDSEDSFLIDEDRVIGVVKFHVPKLGIVMRFVQLRWYFVVALLVLVIILFRLLKYYFSLRNEDGSGDTSPDENTASDQISLHKKEEMNNDKEQEEQ